MENHTFCKTLVKAGDIVKVFPREVYPRFPEDEKFIPEYVRVVVEEWRSSPHKLRIYYSGTVKSSLGYTTCGADKLPFVIGGREDILQLKLQEGGAKILNFTGFDIAESNISDVVHPCGTDSKTIARLLKLDEQSTMKSLSDVVETLTQLVIAEKEVNIKIQKVIIYGEAPVVMLLRDSLRRSGFGVLYAIVEEGKYKRYIEI